ATSTFPESVRCPQAGEAVSQSRLVQLERGPLHVSVNPVAAEGEALGELVIVHDMSFVQRRSEDTKKYIFYLFAAIATVVALITVVIAEISWRGWVAGLKVLLKGQTLLRSPDSEQKGGLIRATAPELRPIARDLQALVLDLESERRSRDEGQTTW